MTLASNKLHYLTPNLDIYIDIHIHTTVSTTLIWSPGIKAFSTDLTIFKKLQRHKQHDQFHHFMLKESSQNSKIKGNKVCSASVCCLNLDNHITLQGELLPLQSQNLNWTKLAYITQIINNKPYFGGWGNKMGDMANNMMIYTYSSTPRHSKKEHSLSKFLQFLTPPTKSVCYKGFKGAVEITCAAY